MPSVLARARHNSFPNDGSLKLSEDAHHLIHGPAGWRRRIDFLLMQVEVDTFRMQVA